MGHVAALDEEPGHSQQRQFFEAGPADPPIGQGGLIEDGPMDQVGKGDVLAVEAVGVETGHPTVPLGIIARRGSSRGQAIGFEALHRVVSGPIEPIEMQADVQVGVCAVGLRRPIRKGDEPVRATDEHHLKTRRLEVSGQVDGQI